MIYITQYYLSGNENRQRELVECFHKNINNRLFEEVYFLMNEDYDISFFESDKVHKILFFGDDEFENRINYYFVFDFCNKNFIDKICVFSNSDICFDDTLLNISNYDMDNTCLALTRYNVLDDKGNCEFMNRVDSQDTWIFKPILKNIENLNKDIRVGLRGCDNSIAYDLEKNGIRLINPCKKIKTYHYHLSDYRKNAQYGAIYGKFPYLTIKFE